MSNPEQYPLSTISTESAPWKGADEPTKHSSSPLYRPSLQISGQPWRHCDDLPERFSANLANTGYFVRVGRKVVDHGGRSRWSSRIQGFGPFGIHTKMGACSVIHHCSRNPNSSSPTHARSRQSQSGTSLHQMHSTANQIWSNPARRCSEPTRIGCRAQDKNSPGAKVVAILCVPTTEQGRISGVATGARTRMKHRARARFRPTFGQSSRTSYLEG